MVFCSNCGSGIKEESTFCSSCGKKVTDQASSPTLVATPIQNSGKSSGLAKGGLAVGIICLVIGLYDLGSIQNGSWVALADSEIGILLVLSMTSLGLSIAALVQKQKNAIGALIIAIISVMVMLLCAPYAVSA